MCFSVMFMSQITVDLKVAVFFYVFRDIGRLLDDCLCHIGGFKDGFHGYVSFQPADKKTCLVWTRRTLGI